MPQGRGWASAGCRLREPADALCMLNSLPSMPRQASQCCAAAAGRWTGMGLPALKMTAAGKNSRGSVGRLFSATASYIAQGPGPAPVAAPCRARCLCSSPLPPSCGRPAPSPAAIQTSRSAGSTVVGSTTGGAAKHVPPHTGGTCSAAPPAACLHALHSGTPLARPCGQQPEPACAHTRPMPQCTYESGLESGATQLLLPPSLNDTHLLPFLEKYQERFPLWRLDLSDIGSHWHAFAGWDCAGGGPGWASSAWAAQLLTLPAAGHARNSSLWPACSTALCSCARRRHTHPLAGCSCLASFSLLDNPPDACSRPQSRRGSSTCGCGAPPSRGRRPAGAACSP